MPLGLANRLSSVSPSMTMKVTAKAAELRAQGVDVISFGAGEPDFDTPSHIKEAAKRALDNGATKYTAVEGTPQLRKAVAEWFAKTHGFAVSAREVMVSAGAKQVIHNAFHALLDAGDEVILTAPCWVSYAEIAKLAGATPVPVLSRAADNFALDPDAIARAITPATRMIVLCSPSNPTGAIYDELTLRAVAKLALKHDLLLLTDDIYRSLCYSDERFVQPATFGPEIPQAHHHRGWRVQDLCHDRVAHRLLPRPGRGHRGYGHAAGTVDDQRGRGQPGGGAGGHRRPERRARDHAPGVRQTPQVHAGGLAGHARRRLH